MSEIKDKAQLTPKCRTLADVIEKSRYKISYMYEDSDKCIIDFKHPNVEVKEPATYFLSSVFLNKKDNSIEATVRGKISRFKEFYGDYCCENNENMCRPHVNIEDKIFSVEVNFHENPVKKFTSLLQEML